MSKDRAGARILIVDDERNHLTALCDTLGEKGFETTGFAAPGDALAAVREQEFDLLLTDLMMPSMNGIELLQAARQIQPDLVGVLMTGHGTIDTAVEAMRVGALDYILKPFKLSTVSLVLTRALAIRELRLENAALTQRLLERARELEAKNEELDAFSLAVSHDLGAPLRAIRGYAEMIRREFGSEVPESVQAPLTRVIDSAQRMQDLIRDLLQLARLGRSSLIRRRVEMSALAREIAAELRQQDPGRDLEVRVGDLPDALADASLLRQVFVNLLSNAFKFTRHTEGAFVEIGGESGPDEHTYWVKDNGAGFDMAYAKKLFGIFKRLHSESEFEGVGVGLSTVRRVVERHGGRVWAEGAVGKGAAFRFTLPVAEGEAGRASSAPGSPGSA